MVLAHLVYVAFVMYFSRAKFEEHCFNISGDILNSVFYCLSVTIYDAITFLICIMQKRGISKTKKDIPKMKMPFFFTLKGLPNKLRAIIVLLHRHFNGLNSLITN